MPQNKSVSFFPDPIGLPNRRAMLGLALSFTLFTAGCSGAIERVYVELPVLAPPHHSDLPDPSFKASTPASDWVLPGLDSTNGPSDGIKSSRVTKALAQNRDRRYQQLLARLLADYRRKAVLLRAERAASFSGIRSDALARANDKISVEYINYANAKGPLVVSLALLAGFPDPDQRSKRVPPPTDAAANRRFEAARRLRQKITALDTAFAAFTQRTLKESEAATTLQINDLLAELNRQLAKIEENTRLLAAQELGKTQNELRPLLADERPIGLPGIPTKELHFPASSLVVPQIDPVKRAPDLDNEPQKELETELRVWLRVNRYVLARKGSGRDATREFLAWRQTFNPPYSQTHAQAGPPLAP